MSEFFFRHTDRCIILNCGKLGHRLNHLQQQKRARFELLPVSWTPS
jgi:hypothetical protein